MTIEETQKALYETMVALYKLSIAFKGQKLESNQESRIKNAEYILSKYSDIKDVLRNEVEINEQ